MPGESSLHASIKQIYKTEGALEEVRLDGYWIDIVSGDQLIEIQTGNFFAIKAKLEQLLERHPIRLVHPIPLNKWIVQPGADIGSLTRRKSPRRGRIEDVFRELIYIPHLIRHPNFTLEVVLTTEEELREADGRGSWRRKFISIIDRRLIEIIETRRFSTPNDFLSMIPSALMSGFTNRNLSDNLHIPLRLAGKMTYCLRNAGLLQIFRKEGRHLIYMRNPEYK